MNLAKLSIRERRGLAIGERISSRDRLRFVLAWFGVLLQSCNKRRGQVACGFDGRTWLRSRVVCDRFHARINNPVDAVGVTPYEQCGAKVGDDHFRWTALESIIGGTYRPTAISNDGNRIFRVDFDVDRHVVGYPQRLTWHEHRDVRFGAKNEVSPRRDEKGHNSKRDEQGFHGGRIIALAGMGAL